MRLTRTGTALLAAGLVGGAALGISGLATAASPSPAPPSAHDRPGAPAPFDGPGEGHGRGHLGEHGGYGGLVTAVTGTSLSVRTPEGVETVGLNGSTAFYKGRTPASRSDVRPGEVVRIRLADPRASTKVASVVVLVPARISGWVTKVDDASLTVTDRDGFTRTIRTTGATTYEKDGATAARAVVAVGTFVHALGSVDADGTTLDAERVLVGRPARPAGAPDGGGPDA